jgi:hypothetical protein
MAADKGVAEAQEFERRNTDPTVPVDGADPENIAGPYSNVELEIGDRKRTASLLGASDESTRLRPEFARQAAKTGDAVTDSDVIANPSAGLNVAEDSGTRERQERDEELGVAGLTSTPPSGSNRPAPAKSTPPAAKGK